MRILINLLKTTALFFGACVCFFAWWYVGVLFVGLVLSIKGHGVIEDGDPWNTPITLAATCLYLAVSYAIGKEIEKL